MRKNFQHSPTDETTFTKRKHSKIPELEIEVADAERSICECVEDEDEELDEELDELPLRSPSESIAD